MSEPLRVYLVDDHPVVRQGMRALLSSLDGITVVGEAATGADALERVPGAKADVVVMDLHLPDRSGIDVTRQLVAEQPGLAVLVLTMLDDDASVFEAMRAGAYGYVLKGADQDDLARAIRAIARGDAIFGPAVAARVLRLFHSQPARRSTAFPHLSDREAEVLDHLARGHSNIEIARHLSLSLKTVRNHVSNIFAKLHVADRTEAALRARDAGLGRDA